MHLSDFLLGAFVYLTAAVIAAPLFKRLEGAGLVVRQRDPEDQRRVLIALTEAGSALKAQAADIPWTMLCQLPLPPEEAVALKATLTRLAAGLGEMVTDED